MKKYIIVSLIVVSLFLTYLAGAKAALAFWPFDGGQVKGVTTTDATDQGGIAGMFKNIMDKIRVARGGGVTNLENGIGPGGIGGTRPDPSVRLNQAVIDGKLTQTQATEILSRFNAIKAKQVELMTLEKSLADWMKTNNLSTGLLNGGPANENKGVGESRLPRPSETARPSGYVRQPESARPSGMIRGPGRPTTR